MLTRFIGTVILVALVCAVLAPFVQAAREDVRRDINGEELPYNAPCSTDTDCFERFGY